MLQWKILLIGVPDAGKSTLCKALLRHGREVIKTQAPEYHGDMIMDLPGEYLTHPHLRRVFLSQVHNVKAMLFLAAANDAHLNIPPGLLHTLPGVRVIGVITKVDLEDRDIERTRGFLAAQGIREPFFEVSSLNEASVAGLRNWLIEQALLPKPEEQGAQGETRHHHS